MARDAADEPGSRPLLTFGRVDLVRVQVGYRDRPDGPAFQQFLIDVPVPETLDARGRVLDAEQVLAALEPVLYAGARSPHHYSVHQHRWHTSWGASPGALEIGLLVTTGPRRESVVSAAGQVGGAFRDLLAMAGSPENPPVSRDAAIVQARRAAATACGLEPEGLAVSAEQHHPGVGSWAVRLRTASGDEYDVVVGFVDGYAGAVEVRHEPRAEVFDAVGLE